MNGNPTQPLLTDAYDMQNAVREVFSETLKALPKAPSWMESMADFVKLHPWISLFIFLAVAFVISAIVREAICAYLKTNEILARLKKLEEKMKSTEKT